MIRIYGRLYDLPEDLGECPACRKRNEHAGTQTEPGTLVWQEKARGASESQDRKPARAWVCNQVSFRHTISYKLGRLSDNVSRHPCGYAVSLYAVFDDPDAGEKLKAGCNPESMPLTPAQLANALQRLRDGGYPVWDWLTNEKDVVKQILGVPGRHDGTDETASNYDFHRALMQQRPRGAPTRHPHGTERAREE